MPGERADNFIRVIVDSKGLKAEIAIAQNAPAEYLTPEILEALLLARGVEVGPGVRGSVQALLKEYSDAQATGITRVVAQAIPPVHGTDATIEFLPRYQGVVTKRVQWERAAESEKIDHYARSTLCLVEKGSRIGTYVRPTSGVEGRAVTGAAIQAQDGKPLQFTLAPTIVISEQTAEVSVTCDGILELAGSTLRVSETLDVPGDADFSTGNIDFAGSVTIRGGVKDCFSIKCRDSLTVYGLVGAAVIRTGLDAEFHRGMAAKEKGTLEVGRDLVARYCENVVGHIGRDITVANAIQNCDLHCGGSVRGPRATFSGGRLSARIAIELAVLGSEGAAPTEVELGRDPRIEEKLRAAANADELLRTQIEKLQERAKQLRVGGKTTSSQADEITEIQLEASGLERKRMSLRTSAAKLLGVLGAAPRPTLHVTQAIHPGVRLAVGAFTCQFHATLSGDSTITLDHQSSPVLTRGGSQPHPLAQFARIETDGTRAEFDRLIRSLEASVSFPASDRSAA